MRYLEVLAMGRKNPKYMREFKAEAVRLFRESGKSRVQAAKDIGIAASTLGWLLGDMQVGKKNRFLNTLSDAAPYVLLLV